MRELREAWTNARKGNGGINVNGMDLDGFDLIGNGEIFHDDPEKQALLERLDPIVVGLCWHNMAHFVLRGAPILWRVRNNLAAVLDGKPVPTRQTEGVAAPDPSRTEVTQPPV